MGKITFVLGGVRSGKSRFAIRLAKEKGRSVAFIATCQGLDREMQRRIIIHKKSRPLHWRTFEVPENTALLLKKINDKFDVIVIDCLTLLISNLLLKGVSEDSIEKQINGIMSILGKIKARSIIVSNEVGLGIVPENKLARDFRDIAGRINQIVAAKSNEVFFMFSGIPSRIK